MAQKYDESEGVWRTIGGRRVFIRTGQSLSSAMKESGKFPNYKGNKKKRDDLAEKNKELYEKNTGFALIGDKKEQEEREKAHQEWLENREKMKELEKQTIYGAQGKTDSTYIKDTVKQEANKEYEYKDAYKSYKEKFNKTWGAEETTPKKVSASMYTNDEFMEHLEDANWHTERKIIADAKLTNKQLEYVKNNTNVNAWSADLNRAKTEQLIKEAKIKYPKEINPTKYSVTSASISKYSNMFNEYKKLHPNTKMNLQKFARMMMDLD